MEKFLKEYVKMFTECNGETLTKKEINGIVQKLQDTNEIWTTLDHYINSYIVEK